MIGGKFLANRAGKIIAGALATLLAGGITSIALVQPAVEKAADYGAKAVELYCGLPAVDRARFRDEVNERLQTAAQITVRCPADLVP